MKKLFILLLVMMFMATAAFVLVRQQDQEQVTTAKVFAIAEVVNHETTFQSTGHDVAFANTTTQHQHAYMLQDEVTNDAEFNSVAGTEDQFRPTYDVDLKMIPGETVLSIPQAVACAPHQKTNAIGIIEEKTQVDTKMVQAQFPDAVIAST